MSVSIEDRLKQFVPAFLYYPYKIAKERRRLEPEMAILRDLVAVGSTAIDVGANRGYYSYALSKVAARVEAFEPNPVLASFARRKLGPKVNVHQAALSDHEGTETFYVPQSSGGVDSHLVGNLGNLYPTLENVEYQVRVATLDAFDFDNVGFIKIDVEGNELPVIEGAARTISRCRPNLVVELLVGWHVDRLEEIEGVNRMFDYNSWVVVDGRRIDARRALEQSGSKVNSNNVLFTPK
jgi:FkbM family methyltransferase